MMKAIGQNNMLLWNRLLHDSWQCSLVLHVQERNPLHHAAKDGDLKVVSELIDSGANVNAEDDVSIYMCNA